MQHNDNDNLAVIMDIGSSFGKVGYMNQTEPTVFTSIVSYPRHLQNVESKHFYAGDHALAQRPIQVYLYPVQRGLVTNWSYMERLWEHSLLRFDPTEHPLMLLEHPLTPNDAREKTAQIMFETFKVPALYFLNPCVASLHAVGRTSGVGVNIGGQTIYSMAVKDGKAIKETLQSLDIGNKDVVTSFLKHLDEIGRYGWTPSMLAYQYLANDCLSKIGYIALDYDIELQKPKAEVAGVYEDTNDFPMELYHERFMHTEMIFKPELYGLEKDGIHNMIFNSVKKCDPDIQSELFNNIVLWGGASMIRGLDERLIKELKILSPEHSDHIRIESGPQGISRRYLPFIGAARMAQTFTDWVTKAEYDETGHI